MKSYKFIRESLPGFLFDDEIFKKTILAIAMELDSFDEATDDLLKQLFPQTCTWAINYWEDFCGINNEDKSLHIRRAKVISKLSQVSPITLRKVENIVRNFVKDSYVENIPKQYKFKLNLNGEFDFNLQQLREVIEDIKPAHLDYVIRYILVYILKYKIDTFAEINTTIDFHNSAYNIPTYLLLNGLGDLNGEYYLSGAIRPDGIKKTFYFITEKVFEYLYKYKYFNLINTYIAFRKFNYFNNICITNSIISFYNSVYNIPTHLDLNGIYKLNGVSFLNGSTRSSGFKKRFYSIISTIIKNSIIINKTSKITFAVSSTNVIKISHNYSGGNYRFKALNSKYNLDGQVNLSNKTELLQEV